VKAITSTHIFFFTAIERKLTAVHSRRKEKLLLKSNKSLDDFLQLSLGIFLVKSPSSKHFIQLLPLKPTGATPGEFHYIY